MSKGSVLARALFAPANIIGLATAGGAAWLLHQPLPALVALGAEAVYLLLVAGSARVRRALGGRSGTDSEEVETRLGELAESQRGHYFVLRDLKDSILANYRKLPGGGVLAASSEPRLDALLTAFLRLLSTLNDHRRYLGIADRDALQREVARLEVELGKEQNPRLREVEEKRADILRQRLKRFAQAEESRAVVSHQLASIEDLLRLAHEQSIAIRDPASVNSMLEVLAAEVASTEETVREMERFMEVTDELAPRLEHRSRVSG